MAQDLAFSGSSVRANVGAALGAVSFALAGCGGQGSGEPPQALSNVQRQVCLDEGIEAARKILDARNEQAGKGLLNKVYTPKDTPTDRDIFSAEQRRAEALCLQETRAGLRKDAEDAGTKYPAFGTAGQAGTAATAPAPAAPVPVVVVPVPVPVLPHDAGIDPAIERLDPPAPAASAPSAGASAPEGAASAPRSPMDYIKYGKRGNPASAPDGQSR